MIDIEVIGVETQPLPDSDILTAAEFALRELMPRKKRIDITIEVCHTGDSCSGFHWMEDKHVHMIELDFKQTTEDFLTCLFHEMVHVRQAERGINDDESLPYYERPNEIEAYQLQEELLEKWKSYSRSSLVE